jgi:hypothetical protein
MKGINMEQILIPWVEENRGQLLQMGIVMAAPTKAREQDNETDSIQKTQ